MAALVKVSYASCTMFSNLPQTCPLCGEHVPGGTVHQCGSGGTRSHEDLVFVSTVAAAALPAPRKKARKKA